MKKEWSTDLSTELGIEFKRADLRETKETDNSRYMQTTSNTNSGGKRPS